MRSHVEYRAKGGAEWKASCHVSKALDKRKATAMERIIEVLWPPCESPRKSFAFSFKIEDFKFTERDQHTGLLPLFRPHCRFYKSAASTPRIEAIKAALGAEGREHLRRAFCEFLDSLKMKGHSRIWRLQEQGKIPIFGALAFNMRLLGIDGIDAASGCLVAGVLEKRTNKGEVVDPVARAVPLALVSENDTIRYRFLVIWNTDAFCVGAMNGRKRDLT